MVFAKLYKNPENNLLIFPWQKKPDILLNVFLAIAVDNLGDAEDMDEIEKEKEVRRMAIPSTYLRLPDDAWNESNITDNFIS